MILNSSCNKPETNFRVTKYAFVNPTKFVSREMNRTRTKSISWVFYAQPRANDVDDKRSQRRDNFTLSPKAHC